MAAQPLVRASYAVPVETFEVNIMGTVNVLEACRQSADVRAIVNITSDKCYQNNETGQAYKETDAMGGYDPYSASKGAAEIVANSYRNSFFHPNDYGKMHNVLLADVRAGNVIGGGDWATDRLIPDLAKAASQGKTVAIRSPYAVRPWQHVLEPLSGYLLIGQRLLEEKAAFADNWNFGPSNNATMTVGRVVELASNSWESIKYSVEASPVSVHEAQLLTLDSTKARNQLQWSSIWDTDATVSKAVDWYKRYYTANEITSLEDLTAYIDDAVLRDAVWTKSAIESRNDD
jgi:CDP-glucose 4,6-dehydratase